MPPFEEPTSLDLESQCLPWGWGSLPLLWILMGGGRQAATVLGPGWPISVVSVAARVVGSLEAWEALMVNVQFVNALAFTIIESRCIINAGWRRIARGLCGLCSKLCFHLRVEYSKYKLMIQAIIIMKPQHRQADKGGLGLICSQFNGKCFPVKSFFLPG